MNNCPIKSPSGLCNLCSYGKEGVCDYPYRGAMSLEQINAETKKLKETGCRGGRRVSEFSNNLLAKWDGIVAGSNLLKRFADSVELAPPAWWWQKFKGAHRN